MQNTLPDGFMMRRPTLDDIPAIYSVFAARAASEGHAMDITEADMRNFWQIPGFDPAQDAWLVLAPDGQAVAVGNMDTHDPARMFLRSSVHPGYKHQGLFAYLLELAQERAVTRIADAPPDARVTFNTFCFDSNTEACQALEQAGFEHVRSNWIMQIEMQEEPARPVWPKGIMLRPFTMDMLRAVFEANDEAFQDHWGHVPQEFECWQTWSVKREGFDAALWFIAYAGDEIAGVALCDQSNGESWVGELSVRRPWRKLGLGLALLQQAFGEFYRRGERKVKLHADSQNLTGAIRLYTRAGMHPVQQSNQYQKELRPGVEASTQALEV